MQYGFAFDIFLNVLIRHFIVLVDLETCLRICELLKHFLILLFLIFVFSLCCGRRCIVHDRGGCFCSVTIVLTLTIVVIKSVGGIPLLVLQTIWEESLHWTHSLIAFLGILFPPQNFRGLEFFFQRLLLGFFC